MYQSLIRPCLFALSPENAHDAMRFVARPANVPWISSMMKAHYHVDDPRLHVHAAGLQCVNPVGLAAGLDKNAELLGLWNGLDFGHIELGTVTAKSQPGNPKPRIFRLPEDKGLINRMGFPSEGADALQHALRAIRRRYQNLPPLGINIGKSKVTEVDDAIDDYCYSFDRLAPLADYITVNISSPNTPGLRQLQERDRLNALLAALQQRNQSRKAIFVKVAPDLTFSALEEVIASCVEASVAGIIATNTTLSREGLKTSIDQAGGLSGEPLRKRSLEVVKFIGSRLNGQLALIGVGGISSSNDALDLLAAGATMVQLYTALIYEGPGLVRAINSGLVSFMDEHSCGSLQEAAAIWRSIQQTRACA